MARVSVMTGVHTTGGLYYDANRDANGRQAGIWRNERLGDVPAKKNDSPTPAASGLVCSIESNKKATTRLGGFPPLQREPDKPDNGESAKYHRAGFRSQHVGNRAA